MKFWKRRSDGCQGYFHLKSHEFQHKNTLSGRLLWAKGWNSFLLSICLPNYSGWSIECWGKDFALEHESKTVFHWHWKVSKVLALDGAELGTSSWEYARGYFYSISISKHAFLHLSNLSAEVPV